VDTEFVELAQGTSILILVLIEASEFDILLSVISMLGGRKECVTKPRTFIISNSRFTSS
jgi:hypothetical protein